MITTILRLFLFALIVFSFTSIQLAVKLFTLPFNSEKISCHILKFFSLCALKLFNVEITVSGNKTCSESCFICSNHSSTIDMLMLIQTGMMRFITSVEAGSSLFTGILTRLSGTIFVERRSRSSVRKDIKKIRTILHEGFSR